MHVPHIVLKWPKALTQLSESLISVMKHMCKTSTIRISKIATGCITVAFVPRIVDIPAINTEEPNYFPSLLSEGPSRLEVGC